MTEYLQKYNDIMKKYHCGEFGDTHLTMRDILYRAEEPDLFDKMSLDDLQYLIENTSGIHKQMFGYLKFKKEQEVQEL
jgi:hypothetical protein